MKKVSYSNEGGLGLILNANDNERDFIKSKDFIINGKEIKSETMTDLFGLFAEPVRFAGVLNNDENCMCFMLGKGEEDLFDIPTYYSCFYWISENRLLANKYREGTVRVYKWINGAWKQMSYNISFTNI